MRVAASRIDALLANAEPQAQLEIYGIICASSDFDRNEDWFGLPSWAFLYVAVLEWMGSSRSGVWQYYEGLPPGLSEPILQELRSNSRSDIADVYASGLKSWDGDEMAGEVDTWIDLHSHEIGLWLNGLAKANRESLLALASS